MEIKITNKRIIDFVKKYDIDIELFLLKNIDFYEYVLSSINENNTAQILPYILTQNNLINNLIDKQNKMETNIEIVKNNKAIFISEVEKLRNDNTNNVKDIQNIILKNNVDYINTTSNIINELEKSINSTNSKDISNFEKRIMENNKELLTNTKETILNISNNNEKDIKSLSRDIELITNKSFTEIKEYFNNFNDKNSFSIQQITSGLANDLTNIKSCIDDTKNTINNMFQNKNSSDKGKLSENRLETQLSIQFPTYTIDRTSVSGHSGDFILKTKYKPDILIENKDYSVNVNKEEINKFHRDIKENNICGILISQNSGISNKNDFSIDIVDGNILMYIHNCKYDMEKVKHAIDIIYSLYDYVSKNKNINKNNIEDTTYQNIEKEYLEFIKNRNDIMDTLNTSIKNLRKMDLVSVKLILEKYNNILPITVSNDISCQICNKIFTSVAGLSAHKKKHLNEKKKVKEP
jgi:hypothetical protein